MLNLLSPECHPLDHQHLPHRGKITPRLHTPPHRCNFPPNWHAMRPRPLGPRGAGTEPSTLTTPTAVHRECPTRACETDTTLVQSPEHGLGVWCRVLGDVVPVLRMRPLPVPGAWQGRAGIQWKGTIRMTARHFGPSPHPSPGAYKRRITKPSTLSLSPHSCLPASHCLRLFAAPNPSPLCSALPSLHLVVCLSLHLHSGLVCDRRSSGPVQSMHFHEPWQSV